MPRDTQAQSCIFESIGAGQTGSTHSLVNSGPHTIDQNVHGKVAGRHRINCCRVVATSEDERLGKIWETLEKPRSEPPRYVKDRETGGVEPK